MWEEGTLEDWRCCGDSNLGISTCSRLASDVTVTQMVVKEYIM
jgi:hypothetical protein